MSEMAMYRGTRIKIGTCEDMYYLRADQAHLVEKVPGSVDAQVDGKAGLLRFRFPFPDEDGTEPGRFEPYNRAVPVLCPMPADLEHFSIQFIAQREGYNLCIPCPEGSGPHPVKVHRNGFSGPAFISAQKWFDGSLITVCRCVCGGLWRLETLRDAQPVIGFCRAAAKDEQAEWWNKIADRIEAGYVKGERP